MRPLPEGRTFAENFDAPPAARVLAIGLAGLCAGLAVLQVLLHRRQLLRAASAPLVDSVGKRRRRLVFQIVWLIPIFGLTSLGTLLAPRARYLMELSCRVAEALALEAFWRLLGDLLGGEAAGQQLLQGLPASRFLAVPPVCCVFRCFPCVRCALCQPSVFTPTVGKWVGRCVRQYKLVVPLTGFLMLWLQLNSLARECDDRSDDQQIAGRTEAALLALEVLEQLSMLCCLWGLFVYYKLTHELLQHCHPTAMFALVKVPIAVTMMQQRLVLLVMPDQPTSQSLDPIELNALLTCIEMLAASCLVRYAFPPGLLTKQCQEPAELQARASPGASEIKACDEETADGTADGVELSAGLETGAIAGEDSACRVEPEARSLL